MEKLELPVPSSFNAADPRFFTDFADPCFRFCLLCKKYAPDYQHLSSERHQKRALDPEWWLSGREVSGSDSTPTSTTSTATQQMMPPASPPPQGAPKTCSWCAKQAIDKVIEGTKAKYCDDCWNWWQQQKGQGAGAGCFEVGSAAAPPPPMTGIRACGVPALPRGAAPPPPPPCGRSVSAVHGRPLAASLAMRWLDGDEICV